MAQAARRSPTGRGLSRLRPQRRVWGQSAKGRPHASAPKLTARRAGSNWVAASCVFNAFPHKWCKVANSRPWNILDFCIGQQNLEQSAAQNMVGIGVDPPASAVETHHRHKDGHPADVPYDLGEPRHLYGHRPFIWKKDLQCCSSEPHALFTGSKGWEDTV